MTLTNRTLRTYIADCASFAVSCTQQVDLQQAPAFAVRVINEGHNEHTQAVRESVRARLTALEEEVSTNQLAYLKVEAARMCLDCLCDDSELPRAVKRAHQRVTLFLQEL